MNSLLLAPGKEVLSYCGKCKLKLAHIIVTMKDRKTVGKVECKTCKSNHSFKESATSAAPAKRRMTSSKRNTVIQTAAEMWSEKNKHLSKNEISYSIRTKFSVGDCIAHPSFGLGYVQTLVSNERIEVLFQHDIKTLVHNKQ